MNSLLQILTVNRTSELTNLRALLDHSISSSDTLVVVASTQCTKLDNELVLLGQQVRCDQYYYLPISNDINDFRDPEFALMDARIKRINTQLQVLQLTMIDVQELAELVIRHSTALTWP